MKIKSLAAAVFMLCTLFSGIDSARAEWNASSPVSVISREDGSGTRGAFVELFGVLGEIKGKKADLTTLDAQNDGLSICWGKLGTVGQSHFIPKADCKSENPLEEGNIRIQRKIREGYSFADNTI